MTYNHYNHLLMSNPGGAARANKQESDAGSLFGSSYSSVASSSRGVGAYAPYGQEDRARRRQVLHEDDVDFYASIVCSTAAGQALFYSTALDAGGQCWG